MATPSVVQRIALINNCFSRVSMPNNPAQARLLAVRGGDGEHLVDHVQMPRIAMNVGILFLPQASILAAFGPYSTFLLASDKEYVGASSLFWISLVVGCHFPWCGCLLGYCGLKAGTPERESRGVAGQKGTFLSEGVASDRPDPSSNTVFCRTGTPPPQ